MITGLDQGRKKTGPVVGKEKKGRSYSEVVALLDALKLYDYSEQAVQRMQKLDQVCGSPSSKLDIVLVGGTNGKSSTMHFASKLLKEEGYKTGIVYSKSTLTYNERINIETEDISNKAFAEFVEEVIDIAEENKIQATSYEVIMMASLKYFLTEDIKVVLIEVYSGGRLDAAVAFKPVIAAVTRIAEDQYNLLDKDLDQAAFEMLAIAKKGCWFVSAEQSKLRLQKMKTWIDERDIKWAMPIRKLASLPYMYEQLFGRSASLGERIAQIYVEDIQGKFSPFLRGNLLATQKGQRGRPTLEAKRQSELNPIKTLKMFWNDQFSLLKGRFELLDKEKPSILLDNAENIDALENFFLGVRLLHYQKSLKGLAVIIGISESVNLTEVLKLIRYLTKKVGGEIFFVPLQGKPCHSVQTLVTEAKELNIKAKGFTSFNEAFEQAKTVVDERDGLVIVTGSLSLITEYWKNRGMKKL